MVDNAVRIKISAELDENQSLRDTQRSLDRLAQRLSLNIKDINLGSAIGGFLGGAAINTAINAVDRLVSSISAIGTASLQSARGIETLENALTFAGVNNTNQQIENLLATSERLGISFNVAANSYKQLLFAFQGTNLEDQTAQVFEGLAAGLAARQATAEQQNRAFIAISQIAQKGVFSAEEVRGQLAEALPGAIATLARSQGLTVQEFNRALNQGQLGDVAEVLPRFAEELRKESDLQFLRIEDSNIKRLADFNNQLELTRVEIGRILTPFSSLSLQVGRFGLEGLNSGLQLVRRNLTGISTVLATLAAQRAIPVILSGPGFATLNAGINTVATSLGRVSATLITIVAVSEGLKILGTVLDAGNKEIRIINQQLNRTLAELKGVNEEAQNFDLGAVAITGDTVADLSNLGRAQEEQFNRIKAARDEAFAGGDFGQGVLLDLRLAGQALNVFAKSNQLQDVLNLSADQRRIEEIIDSAGELRREFEKNINTQNIAQASAEYEKTSVQIEAVRGQIERLRALPADTGTTEQLKELQGVLAELTQTREANLTESFGLTPTALDATISRLQETIAILEQLPELSNDQAIALKQARLELAAQIRLQEQYNSFLGESVSLAKTLANSVAEIGAQTSLTNQQFSRDVAEQTLQIKQLQALGEITPDVAQERLLDLDTSNIERELTQTRNTIQRLTNDITNALTPITSQKLTEAFRLVGIDAPLNQLIAQGDLTSEVISNIAQSFEQLKGTEIDSSLRSVLTAIGQLSDLRGQELDLGIEQAEIGINRINDQTQETLRLEKEAAQQREQSQRDSIDREREFQELRETALRQEQERTEEIQRQGQERAKQLEQANQLSLGLGRSLRENVRAASELNLFRLEQDGAGLQEIFQARLDALEEERRIELELLRIDQQRQLIAARQAQVESRQRVGEALEKAVNAVRTLSPEIARISVEGLLLAERQAALADASLNQLLQTVGAETETRALRSTLARERLLAEAEAEGITGLQAQTGRGAGIQQGSDAVLSRTLDSLAQQRPELIQQFLQQNPASSLINELADIRRGNLNTQQNNPSAPIGSSSQLNIGDIIVNMQTTPGQSAPNIGRDIASEVLSQITDTVEELSR